MIMIIRWKCCKIAPDIDAGDAVAHHLVDRRAHALGKPLRFYIIIIIIIILSLSLSLLLLLLLLLFPCENCNNIIIPCNNNNIHHHHHHHHPV